MSQQHLRTVLLHLAVGARRYDILCKARTEQIRSGASLTAECLVEPSSNLQEQFLAEERNLQIFCILQAEAQLYDARESGTASVVSCVIMQCRA